jgi:2-keto-4-pentenoate hydratase/2-oxohepta-3-ene-1,7-dioic acid hydratase in catechol pathway
MRFVSYGAPGAERAGMDVKDEIFDLRAAMAAAGLAAPVDDLRAFLEQPGWRAALPALADVVQSERVRPVRATRLGAPVPRPRHVLLAGVNFRQHREEAISAAAPLRPVVLAKAAMSVAGPHDDIVRPPEIAKLDYEGEVAVAIGQRTRRVQPDRALECVAGYTVINDVSGRDLQLAEHETNPFFRVHFLGKSADTFAPTGPYLVTRDEIDDAEPFRIRTWVNGQLRQDGTTRDLIFTIAELIAYISTFVTLYPGDLIATGTPGGVGHFMDPPVYLGDGDVCRVEVDGIGAIENRVRDEAVVPA